MDIDRITSKLIEYKTISGINYNEVNECFNYIKDYFKETKYYISEFSYNNDKSLYISNSKNKKIDVLFIGHVDVVSGDDFQFKPYIKENKLYGRGSFDMKGHVAVILSLLKNNIFKNKVGFLITSDEERGGFNGTYKFLNELNYNAKIAIVPDAGNNFEIIEEEKGVLQLEVHYIGKEAHSSQPWNGDNAIDKIVGLYKALIKKYPLPKSASDYRTSINIAKINGGNLTNMIAENCSMILDIRHIAKDKKEDFINFINEYNSNFNVKVLAEGEPFLTIKENLYYQKFIEVYKNVLQKKVKYNKCESASDGRFLYKKNIPCILMNAKGENMHSKNENIDLNSLETLYKIYYEYLNN